MCGSVVNRVGLLMLEVAFVVSMRDGRGCRLRKPDLRLEGVDRGFRGR